MESPLWARDSRDCPPVADRGLRQSNRFPVDEQKPKLPATENRTQACRKDTKQSGIFWTVRGANAISALRCCQFNGRFEDCWEERRA